MPLSKAGEIYVIGVTDDGNPSSVDASFQIIKGSFDSGITVFSTSGNIQSIDFDDINRILYWSENAFGEGDEFAIKTYDGITEDTIIVSPLPGDEDITDIALDAPNGKIYWVIDDQLFRANLNGSGQETIVTSITGVPFQKIAIDKINNRVFVAGVTIAGFPSKLFVESYDLDGTNRLIHGENVDNVLIIHSIDISPNLDLLYIFISLEILGLHPEVRTRGIGAGSTTSLEDFSLIDDTYSEPGQSIAIEDTLGKLYVVSGDSIFKQDLDGGNREEYTNLSLIYKHIVIIPCSTCEITHVLEPTSTTTSLNFFPTPFQSPTELHLNIDNLDRTCGETSGNDRLTGNEDVSRVKLGFTPPTLSGTDTFFGIFGNICGAFSDAISFVPQLGILSFHTLISGELFLEGILLSKLQFSFPDPTPEGIGTVGGFSWFDPNIVGDLAFHEAIIAAGLDPATVDWSTLEVQITIDSELESGVSFNLHWLAITLFEKTIDPTALGGVVAGGIAQESVVLSIEGGTIISGEVLVSGPVVEEGLGGITVSPDVLVISTETRLPIGGSVVPKTITFVDFVKSFDSFPIDTVCFLSGGSTNGNPLLSLGGEVSFIEAEGNLFDDFQSEESEAGLKDFRCIYIFNNASSAITNLKIWTESSPLSSAAITIGILELNDVQEINLTFFSSNGFFTLNFGGTNVVINAAPTLDLFAQNFQDALRNTTSLTDVVVQAQLIGTTVNFVVTFTGEDGDKKQPTFALVENSLVPKPAISITKTTVGSPINATAESIATDATSPVAEFKETTQILPIIVPILNENEGFPLWIKRTISVEPIATENDGFFLRWEAGTTL